MSDQRPETVSLHGGQSPDPEATVGIEHIDDILGDLDQAFAKVDQAVSA
jgi:hypothetical protein